MTYLYGFTQNHGKREEIIQSSILYLLVTMVKLVPAPKRNLLFAFTQQETSGHKVQTKLHSQKQPLNITKRFF